MLRALIFRIAEAYWAPRRSARRLLAAEPRALDGLMMVVVGVALSMLMIAGLEMLFGRSFQEAFDALVPRPDAAPPREQNDLGDLVTQKLFLSLVVFATVVSLAASLGRRLGGRASVAQLAAVVGWWFIVDSAADIARTLLILLAQPEQQAPAVLAVMLLSVYLFYVLAAFLAEAHGFPSVFPVMATMFAVSMGLGVVLYALLSAAGMKLTAG